MSDISTVLREEELKMSPLISTRNIKTTKRRLYHMEQLPSLSEFEALCSQSTEQRDYPLAASICSNIPTYDLSSFDPREPALAEDLQDEWHRTLYSGPGVLVLKKLQPSSSLIERVNDAFKSIIAQEKATTKGDHFAQGGKNERIWNSFQKHAIHDPDSFVAYYSNLWLSLMCQAWLGPAYRITAQVNIVKPGGKPQISHRDYHLGFQSAESCSRFPKVTQIASQFLTLQGAIAHSDMPLESGPTRFLPFSQNFEAGYMAYRLPEFNAYFESHWKSLPLERGDAVFFNPALMHAAGENLTTNVSRSANLLQISSAFGKPMESVNSQAILDKVWDVLRAKVQDEGISSQVRAAVAAIGEGYPFPTNLDNRPPQQGGMAPKSEQDFLLELLERDVDRTGMHELLQAVNDAGQS